MPLSRARKHGTTATSRIASVDQSLLEKTHLSVNRHDIQGIIVTNVLAMVSGNLPSIVNYFKNKKWLTRGIWSVIGLYYSTTTIFEHRKVIKSWLLSHAFAHVPVRDEDILSAYLIQHANRQVNHRKQRLALAKSLDYLMNHTQHEGIYRYSKHITLTSQDKSIFFKHKGQWFWITKELDRLIKVWTARGKLATIDDRMNDVYTRAKAESLESGVSMFSPYHDESRWCKGSHCYFRSMDTVSLDPKVKSRLVTNIDQFLHANARDWYVNVGRPYRRGYSLYGPPGCGKTSFALAVASKYNLDSHTLSLSAPGMNDELLYGLSSAINHKGCLILIEDIDCYDVILDRVHRQKKAEEKAEAELQARRTRGSARKMAEEKAELKKKLIEAAMPKVTLSGLLNVLDGAKAPEGNIIIMTCNYPQHLDKALTRKG